MKYINDISINEKYCIKLKSILIVQMHKNKIYNTMHINSEVQIIKSIVLIELDKLKLFDYEKLNLVFEEINNVTGWYKFILSSDNTTIFTCYGNLHGKTEQFNIDIQTILSEQSKNLIDAYLHKLNIRD